MRHLLTLVLRDRADVQRAASHLALWRTSRASRSATARRDPPRRLISIRPDQYELQCDAAGALLERFEIAACAEASFPLVLVDDAQDSRPERFRMSCALSLRSAVLVAAEELPCLDLYLSDAPAAGARWPRGQEQSRNDLSFRLAKKGPGISPGPDEWSRRLGQMTGGVMRPDAVAARS